MRTLGWWLVERPVRLLELCSAIVLLLAGLFFSESFVTALFTYGLAVLLLVMLFKSYLDGDRLH